MGIAGEEVPPKLQAGGGELAGGRQQRKILPGRNSLCACPEVRRTDPGQATYTSSLVHCEGRRRETEPAGPTRGLTAQGNELGPQPKPGDMPSRGRTCQMSCHGVWNDGASGQQKPRLKLEVQETGHERLL